MHILQLTIMFLAATAWPFAELPDSVDRSGIHRDRMIDTSLIEFEFNGESIMNSMNIFSDKLSLVAEEPNTPLEGKELYLSMIDYIGDTYYPSLDTAIVQAVMEVESNYIPNVGNPSGAIGLMQIVPKWHTHRAEKYGLSDLWDPYTNILVGMDFLDESYRKHGDYRQALYLYNHSWSYVDHVMRVADAIRGGD